MKTKERVNEKESQVSKIIDEKRLKKLELEEVSDRKNYTYRSGRIIDPH